MVMPKDLWRASMASFFIPMGRFAADQAQAHLDDDQRDDQPVQELSDRAPAGDGVSDAMRLSLSG